MANSVDKIPKGYHSVTPYLVLSGGCSKALELYREAFGAEELMRMEMGSGIGHAEVRIGDSIIMMADAAPPEWPATSSLVMLYVENCDAVFERAVAAGCSVMQPLEDKFYGDRSGTVRDPHGQMWCIATHIEDVSPEEMAKRAHNEPH